MGELSVHHFLFICTDFSAIGNLVFEKLIFVTDLQLKIDKLLIIRGNLFSEYKKFTAKKTEKYLKVLLNVAKFSTLRKQDSNKNDLKEVKIFVTHL